MNRKNRQSKTPARKLRDLDDHLYLLRDFLTKLNSGDETYLKPLAAELRVLACKSSGTEGLLWRVLDELKMNDNVHVHLPGNVNRDHPLAQKLQFSFAVIARAGQGDPRLPPRQWSLRRIIKEFDALLVTGEGYTHEKLIRSVAEQMGSAHEDDGVAPHLVELTRIIFGNRPMLIEVLSSDAELVLEVGERTLTLLERNEGFVRKRRMPILTPTEPKSYHLAADVDDFDGVPQTLPPEGTVMFLLDHPDSDWRQNTKSYDLGLCAQGSMKVRGTKHPDGTVELMVQGFGQSIMKTRQVIPNTNHCGIMVGITWTNREVRFYLCGERVDCQEYPTADSKVQQSSSLWRAC